MILGAVLERFISESPLNVMSRASIEHVLSASALDALFARVAERVYTRELLFSTVVELMGAVVCGKAHHVQSAYQQMADRIPASLKSVYEKLQNIEAAVSAELVRHVADRCHDAFFAIRRHGTTTLDPAGEWTPEVRTDTGWVSERPVWVCVGGEPVPRVRCVRVRLDHPTGDGDAEIEILADVPEDEAVAAVVAVLYRGRWPSKARSTS
ncbi:hypothetical protein [Gemmata obscuriglobus]|uniref:hypothetical protein n=1 Tax=Gemmata obscuriglobus TaxID=114 RepID=UPI00016C5664|nr:hypothetical protein [Gemmata obscuriglobus]VTS11425.1 Transposase IS4 family protein OS=Cyanothece sp. (strain PCC 7822) GN=Cyan7822_1129 PE=4 SV=1 [Gemmata obscuriglobus UQM 2246]